MSFQFLMEQSSFIEHDSARGSVQSSAWKALGDLEGGTVDGKEYSAKQCYEKTTLHSQG